MNQRTQNRRGPEPKPRAAIHQPEQRTDQRTLQTNHTVETNICRAAVAACLAGIAITVWAFGIGPVLGGAA